MLKKIVALILTVVLITTSVALNAIAQTNEIIDIYAGLSTIMVEYSADIEQTSVDTIVIVSENDENIEYTTSVKDNLLTIKPTSDFELGVKYKLYLGDNVKTFKINKIWEPTFTDTDDDGKVDTVSGIKLFSKDNAGLIGVTENNEIVISKTGYIYPDIDTNKEKYKNITLSYKAKRPNVSSTVSPLFNVQHTGSGYLFGAMANGFTKTTLFGWATYNNVTTLRRTYKIYIDNATKYEKGQTTTDSTMGTDNTFAYTQHDVGTITLSATGTNFTGSSTKTATVEYDAAKLASVTPYKLTVDKMGSTAALVIDNALVDTYITQKEYEANGIATTVGKAPEYGYFVIASNHPSQIAVYSDLMLTTTEMNDYKVGDLVVESNGELTGTKYFFDIVFGDSIAMTTDEMIKNYIKVEKNGGNVEYNYEIINDTLRITPVNGIEFDEQYSIKVVEGFGYDNYTVKSDVNLSYIYVAKQGDLEINKIYAGYNDIHITFNDDITEITQEDFEEKVKIFDNGEELLYDLQLSDNTAILTVKKSLAREKIYDLILKKGLGYELVSLKEDIKKYFKLEVLYRTDFASLGNDSIVTDAGYFTQTQYDNEGKIDAGIVTVKDGKLYFTENAYNTLHFDKWRLEELKEDYTISFDVQHYGTANLMVHFNVSSIRNGGGGIHYAAGGNPINSFGWSTDASKGVAQARDFLIKGLKNTTLGTYMTYAMYPYKETYVEEIPTFESDSNDTEILTLPEYSAPVYTYSIDKMGTKGILHINNKLVDIYETNNVYEEIWNSKQTDDAKKVNTPVPDAGYFMIAGGLKNQKGSVKVFGDFYVTRYKEYTDNELLIIDEVCNISGTSATGNIKVRNYDTTSKDAVVLAVAYDENGEFICVEKLIDKKLTAGEIATANVNITSGRKIGKVEFEILDSSNIVKSDDVIITSMMQTDFDNNIITVKGEVNKVSKDSVIYLLLAKDENSSDEWTKTENTNGNFKVVEISPEDETFEYSFKYTGNNDVDKVYPMSLYILEVNEGAVITKKATYNYAGNNAVEAFVTKAKTEKVDYAEISKYAQAIGIDLSYADTDAKKNVLEETFWSVHDTFATLDDIRNTIVTAKARTQILTELKTKGMSVAFVNDILQKYKADAKIDTTKYELLSSKQKSAVCSKFIKADYEAAGYEAFIKAFNEAVETAAKETPVSGGGTGGGAGGGGGGGAVVTPQATPVMGAAGAGEQVVEKTDAVDAPVVTGNFTDLKDYIWAQDAIDYLAEKGVIAGIGNNQFNPEGTVTREQLAKMIVLAFEKYNGDAKNDFADVTSDSWSATYIASAKANGLIKGVSENEFAPLSAVTREDIAVILYRATLLAGKTYETKKENFTDFDDVSDYAKEAVAYMAGTGIINGFEDGSFNPKAPATRAQAAKLIFEALGKGK